MHPVSAYLIKKLLWNLHESNLNDFVAWYNASKQWLENEYEKNNVNY